MLQIISATYFLLVSGSRIYAAPQFQLVNPSIVLADAYYGKVERPTQKRFIRIIIPGASPLAERSTFSFLSKAGYSTGTFIYFSPQGTENRTQRDSKRSAAPDRLQ